MRPTPLSRQLVRGLGLVTAALVLPVLAGCSSDSATDASGTAGSEVAVTATDTSCTLSRSELAAGSTTFEVTNSGSKVTEVYVYGEKDGAFTKVISEVENIGPGTSRDMTVDLGGGTYEIACKPGQTGDGIRATVTVAGDQAAGASTGSNSEAAYDRELELGTDGTSITGLDGESATVGEKIEFKLDNDADGARTLEIKRPDGSVAGEVEIAAGADGELVVELASPGQWQVIVEGAEPELSAPLDVR
ncbi:MAG TPA: cupredoxin domain-containing protein [Actinomycetes bacterium]|nr:cupredoxin domain-containing protein [Actinomycetes bacterium]